MSAAMNSNFSRPSGTPVAPTHAIDRLVVWLKKAGLRVIAYWLQRKQSKKEPEQKKVVVRNDLLTALIRSWVHLVPASATIVLAFINIEGFFIGDSLSGATSPSAQTFYQFLLQVTSKIMELLIVASTGTILTDVLRDVLLYDDRGLPLGLLASKTDFTRISYFWSPEFYSGCAGLKSKVWQWISIFLLLVAGVLAILVGPSTAVLMIPTVRSDWPAGGAAFWLKGSRDDLWPRVLNEDFVGGRDCLDPTPKAVTSQFSNTSGCIWNGYNDIAQFFRSVHFNQPSSLTVNDGALARTHTFFEEGAHYYGETYALASSAAVGLAAENVAEIWDWSIFNSRGRKLKVPRRNLDFRDKDQTRVYVSSPLSIARVHCTLRNFTDRDHIESLSPEWPFLPTDAGANDSINYQLAFRFQNASRIATQWIETPSDEALVLSNGSSTFLTPTAFLGIQSPFSGSNSSARFYACTVDARWTPGVNIGSNVGGGGNAFLQSGLPDTSGGAGLREYTKVETKLGWLNALTPRLQRDRTEPNTNQATGDNWNTLSSIFDGMNIDNSTGAVRDESRLRTSIECVIALVIADGMSRTGYSENGGVFTDYKKALAPGNGDFDASLYESVLNGDARISEPREGEANGMTIFNLTVQASGFSYKADSAGSKLALSILFIHAFFALCHTAYVIIYCKGRTSGAWDTFAELLVIAQNSLPAPAVLANTSGGIERGSTLKKPVRIRAVTTDTPLSRRTGEELQMLFEEPEWESATEGYEKVIEDRAYGTATT